MFRFRVVWVSLTLLGATTASPLPKDDEKSVGNEKLNEKTLRQVTLLMRHGQRAPVSTYPNDPYLNSTMEPYGWGQLTNKGRLNVYNEGLYLRDRYGNFLGSEYTPTKFWLQSTSADRAKMTAMILASALWKPDEKQTFKPDVNWQPVVLHYWTRTEDKLLIIWNACPKYTMERMKIQNETLVQNMNKKYKPMFEEVEHLSGQKMNSLSDISDIYGTLKSEETMGLQLPEWTKDYYPEQMEPLSNFHLAMNVFNEELRRLAGGPFLKKLTRKMKEKAEGTLKPPQRKMYAYIAHDNTLANILTALNVWDRKDPGYNAMILFELHENHEKWYVQVFYKNSPDYKTEPLDIPGCGTSCTLDEFIEATKSVIPENYEEECKVDDPNYVIPNAPPA
ncbi:venom acid phosphatase Acph-1-like [Chelonus insularis]|uniref:venom acid phosphatase Acph-1-like n=1 Tax=Chelonus insularis TaxID=460826 RepID=UPI00158F2D11|nr:venom acid phosphatase Acph-1-like [Chelonus insularis]